MFRDGLRIGGVDARVTGTWAAGDVLEFDGTAIVPGAGGGVTVRKNTGADVGTRPRINLIEGSGVTLTVTDDAGSSEVDITIASSGGLTQAQALTLVSYRG